MKPSIYAFSQANLVDWILENGEKKFRATQIWEWLYRSRVQSFAEMTNLPKSLIEKLEEHFVVNPLKHQNERVSHIVVMGIGEPLDNYDNVMTFLRVVNDDKGLAIGARHITVSTSGLAPKIRDFAREGVQVNLAVSLHAPNNDLRSSIMRINRRYPIEVLFEAIEDYIKVTNRRVTFEYIMLNEVNDGVEQAQELADLTKNIRKLSYINLIPYNPVSEHDQYSRSTKERTLAFFDVLKKNGVNCVVRQEHGTDIDAACGQLRSNTLKKDREKARARIAAAKAKAGIRA